VVAIFLFAKAMLSLNVATDPINAAAIKIDNIDN